MTQRAPTVSFRYRLNDRIEANLRSTLKEDVDIHGEIEDHRLNTLKSELSITSRITRGIFQQADLISGINPGIT
jgi:hypothetical protein